MSQTREIVNGGLLAHSLGRKISILGSVKNVNSNGMSFDIMTTDNMSVTISLSSALDDMLEGYVEVHGTCQGRNAVKADEYIQFSAEQSEDFDSEGHNKLCAFLQQIQNVYNTC